MTRQIGRLLLGAALLPVTALTLSAQTPGVRPAGAVRPLTLDDALRLSSGASEAVGIARAGVDRARGQQAQARSEYFPQLNGSVSYTRAIKSQFSALAPDDTTAGDDPPAEECRRFSPDPTLPISERVDSLESAVECAQNANPFANLGNLPFGRANTWNLGLSFSQNLFTGGRVSAQNRIAAAGRRSAEVELTSQEAQLKLDVTQAYFDAVLSDRLVAIAEAGLGQAERTFENTRLARQVGNTAEFELLRAQVTRDNQRPVVIQRRAQRDVAYLRLKQVLNLPLADSLALVTPLGDSTTAEPPVPAAVAGQAPDTTTETRAAVRRASEAVVVQEGRLGVARAQSLPTVRLTSQFTRFAYPEDGIPSWGDFVSDWNVAVGLQLPLFTGGRLKGDRMVARADLDEARLRLQQTRELAALDARSAQATLDAAAATWEASAGVVEQATRAYDIAEIRFREGISTQTELGDLRLQLQQALANRAQAARDLQVARVRMSLLRDLPLSLSAAPAGATR